MFCHKCGNQIADNAAFCQKCGARMIADNNERPVAAQESSKPIQTQMHDVPLDTPQKKKLGKMPIILGVITLLIVAVVFVALNWEGKTDYEATVRAYTPYANSQGLPYTCGEVFDKYIPDAKWKIHKSGDVAYVDISGTAKGTDKELVVTMQVEEEDGRALMNPVSANVDGRETSTQKETETVFFAFFVAYDEKYEDLSNFAVLLNRVDAALQGEVNLSETYTNDIAGITFNYPSGWVILDSDNEFEVVEMIDSQNNADSIASFKVSSIFDQDPFGVFTGNEASVQAAVNEFGTFLKLEDTLIGDVPAKGLMYQRAGLKGNEIVANFWYFIQNDVYQITCSFSESKADTYEPIFNAIMDSYKITAANTSGESVTSTATYLVDQSSETYQPTLILYQDGKFTLLANLYTGVGIIHGTYNQDDTGHTFNVETRNFSGAIGDDVDNFYMEADGDSLIYASTQQIGMTAEGSRFSTSNDIPETMKEFANSSGDKNYNNTSATASVTDFVGTYSYDASFEDPTGKWNNFYYLLEIGLDGSTLVVTQTWRGNYLFDHARVSPIDVTGNTLVFDTSVVGSTEPEIHSLTYLPAKDSPLGIDTIYIDDDETMPFVRE